MSVLSDLPTFGDGRKRNRSTDKFKNDLDSLFGEDEPQKETSNASNYKKPPSRSRKPSDRSFYSNMALAALEEEDESDPVVTEEDTKKLANSISDLDTMESGAFGSLTKRASTMKQRSSRKNSTTKVEFSNNDHPMKKEKQSSILEDDDELMAELNKGLSLSGSATKGPITKPPQASSTMTKPNPKAKKNTDEFDLDDLLGDSDEDVKKPTNQIAQPQRPRTSRGEERATSSVRLATEKASSSKVEHKPGVDVLRLESSPRSQRRQSAVDETFNDSDILSDLGLGDGISTAPKGQAKAMSSKDQAQKGRGRSSFNLDDVFSEESDTRPRPSGPPASSLPEGTGESESFQAGGYVPSSPSGRRSSLRKSSEEESLGDLSSRPNSAPNKKSVRFLDKESLDDRPSTSPSGPQLQSKLDDILSNKTGGDPKSRRSTVAEIQQPDPSTRPPTGKGRRQSSPAVMKLFGQDQNVSQGQDSENLFPRMEESKTLFPWQTPKGGNTATTEPVTSHTGPAPKSQARPSESAKLVKHGFSDSSLLNLEGTSRQDQVTQVHHQQLQDYNTACAEVKKCQEEIAKLRDTLSEKSAAMENLKGSQTNTSNLQKEMDELKNTSTLVKSELDNKRQEVLSLQARISSVEERCQSLEEGNSRLSSERDGLRMKLSDQEHGHQGNMLKLQQELDSAKMKCHQFELEKSQQSQTIDTIREQHCAELSAVEKSYESRIRTLEDSFSKREARWKQELEDSSESHTIKLQQVERDKLDAVQGLRKKLEGLELARANEVDRLKDMHKSIIEDLKREHELDLQHVKNIHQQEIDALKNTHTHTRTLAELSHKVEFSTKEFNRLQEKLEQNYKRELVQREETIKAREDNLKVYEDRLKKQHLEIDEERVRLQGLIAKMETNMTDQNRQLEKERWQLQQEWSRLHAQQSAFDQERESFTLKMEEERDELMKAKDKFLREQKQLLSQCHEEKRQVALEKAQLQLAQKKAAQKEKEKIHNNIQSEAEVKTAKADIEEESHRLSSQAAKVRAEREKIAKEKAKLRMEKEKTENLYKELQRKTEEANEKIQEAVRVRGEGDKALRDGTAMRELAEEQLRAVKAHEASIHQSQRQLAAERLALANERQELTHLRQSGWAVHSSNKSLASWSSSKENIYPEVLQGHHTTAHLESPMSWSPAVSLEDISQMDKTRSVIDAKQLEVNIGLRQLAKSVQDDLISLAEEDNFLKQLNSSSYN